MSTGYQVMTAASHAHGTLVVVRARGELEALTSGLEPRLLPEERAVMGALAPRRRESWLLGRAALLEALDRLGAPREPLLSLDRGGPRLPVGFTGSISHKPPFGAAIASVSDGSAIGIDLETVDRPRSAIAPMVLTEREQGEVAQLGEADRWPVILARFSLKEAIYKALDPFVGRYVAFDEAEIEQLPGAAPGAVEAPCFTPVSSRLRLAKGEGPFVVETTLAVGELVLATARIRRDV